MASLLTTTSPSASPIPFASQAPSQPPSLASANLVAQQVLGLSAMARRDEIIVTAVPASVPVNSTKGPPTRKPGMPDSSAGDAGGSNRFLVVTIKNGTMPRLYVLAPRVEAPPPGSGAAGQQQRNAVAAAAQVHGQYEARKHWRLDALQSVAGGASGGETVTLYLPGRAVTWTLPDARCKQEFLWLLMRTFNHFIGKPLPTSSLDMVEINVAAQAQGLPDRFAGFLQAARNSVQATGPDVEADSKEGDQDDDSLFGGGATPPPNAAGMDSSSTAADAAMATDGSILLSKEEEKEIAALFSGVDFNPTQAGLFAEHLEGEVGALEAANIYAIVQSEKVVQQIGTKLDTAIHRLERMDAWLGKYTARLSSLRGDIAQIESTNNRMQVLMVNEKALLGSLESLLAKLTFNSQDTDALLVNDLSDPTNLTLAIAASARLRAALQLPLRGVQQMAAMRELQRRLQRLQRDFGDRVATHLLSHITTFAEISLSDKQHLARRATVSRFSHLSLHTDLQPAAPLFEWLRELGPAHHASISRNYTTASSTLYRKEFASFFAELRTSLGRGPPVNRTLVTYAQTAAKPTTESAGASSGTSSSSTSSSSASSSQTEEFESIQHLGSQWALFLQMLLRVCDEEELFAQQFFNLPYTVPDYSAALLSQDSLSSQQLPSASAQQTPSAGASAGASTTSSASRATGSGTGNSSDPMDALQLATPFDESEEAEPLLVFMRRLLLPAVAQELVSFTEALDRHDRLASLRLLAVSQNCLFQLLRRQAIEIAAASELESSGPKAAQPHGLFMVILLKHFISHLLLQFSRYSEAQLQALEELRPPTKHAGIFPVIQALPLLARDLQAIARHESSSSGLDADATPGHLVSFYSVISEATFRWLERTAATDTKYIDLLRLENYHHFYLRLSGKEPGASPPGTRPPNVPVAFAPFLDRASQQYSTSLARYVRWLLLRSFSGLLEYFDAVEGVLRSATPEEVVFQAQYNAAAFQKLLRSWPGPAFERALQDAWKRMLKHLSTEEGLAPSVWAATCSLASQQFERCTLLTERCYARYSLKLPLTQEEFAAMLAKQRQ